MKKKRQHYVWRHYLTGWEADEKLWCRQANGTLTHTNPINLGVEKNFYRLQDLAERDIAFLEEFIARSFKSPMLAHLASGWVEAFKLLPALRAAYSSSGQTSPEGDAALDEVTNNLEEELHTRIEGTGFPLLAKARALDASFLADPQGYVDWTLFAAMQYMRTPTRQNAGLEALNGVSGINPNACWPVLRTAFATNIAFGLFVRKDSLRWTFLRASGQAEFVAADQPIINLAAVGLPEGAPADTVTLFYPIGPRLALEMDFHAASHSVNTKDVTDADVAAYNSKLVGTSTGQVYAASEAALRALAK